MFTSELININEELIKYYLSLDDLLSFGKMFELYYKDFRPIYNCETCENIHMLKHT